MARRRQNICRALAISGRKLRFKSPWSAHAAPSVCASEFRKGLQQRQAERLKSTRDCSQSNRTRKLTCRDWRGRYKSASLGAAHLFRSKHGMGRRSRKNHFRLWRACRRRSRICPADAPVCPSIIQTADVLLGFVQWMAYGSGLCRWGIALIARLCAYRSSYYQAPVSIRAVV